MLVTPTAANKNYQVRAYLGTQATGREYSRTSLIPIENGSVITVVCADDSWPTMNETSDGKRTYTITVVYGEVKSDDAGVTSVKVAGVSAAAGTAENSFSVTLPAGTEVTADSFEITLSDSKATLTGPAKGEDGVWTFTVTAEDGTAVTYSVTVTVKEAKTIHATISMQAENMFIMVPTRVEVSSDLAERYGYADDVTDGVSALDVLVKYHELTFGEDFTKDSKSDYLVVSNGTITTVNGEKKPPHSVSRSTANSPATRTANTTRSTATPATPSARRPLRRTAPLSSSSIRTPVCTWTIMPGSRMRMETGSTRLQFRPEPTSRSVWTAICTPTAAALKAGGP